MSNTIRLSQRLQAVASLVSRDRILADVGTDHGYVPIYLIQQGKIKRAVAMDIRKGPLARAQEHISRYGMGAYIQTRCSDGVEALTPGEADSILIAGMGGGLVIHILEDGGEVCRAARELILQPQSELAAVRRYLNEHGYVTDAEDMVFEDGKYYPMMRVHYDAQAKKAEPGAEQQMYFLYGEGLLRSQHPVLLRYLKKERETCRNILEKLKQQPDSEKIAERIRDMEEKTAYNKAALDLFGAEEQR